MFWKGFSIVMVASCKGYVDISGSKLFVICCVDLLRLLGDFVVFI